MLARFIRWPELFELTPELFEHLGKGGEKWCLRMEYEKGVMELMDDNIWLSQIPPVGTSEFVSENGVEKCSKELSTNLLALLYAVYMIKGANLSPEPFREYCTIYQNAWYTTCN